MTIWPFGTSGTQGQRFSLMLEALEESPGIVELKVLRMQNINTLFFLTM
jgi:hypothetical protein